jgi:hypothetical protein
MVATPAVRAPSQARAGAQVHLSGTGFRAGTHVQILLDTPRPLLLGTALAGPGGDFKTSVVLPHTSPGRHNIQVTGVAALGGHLSLAAPFRLVADQVELAPPKGDLAEPVLLTLSFTLPLATWLALEVLGWRSRRSRPDRDGDQ